jgi:hypothetical protein
MFDLSLGDQGIWYEKVWAAIYLVPSNTKFWKFIFWKFKNHDELLHDKA